MVHVLAIITAKPGMRAQVLAAFNANAPAVRAEEGCIEYVATLDAPGTPTAFGPDTFVVVEKWSSAETLKAHGATSHMASYRERTAGMLAGRTIHVLSPT